MDDRYQEHLIHWGAEHNPDTDEWTPTLRVIWDQDATRTVKKLILFRKTFLTERAALECAHRFAVSWIYAGRPKLPKHT